MRVEVELPDLGIEGSDEAQVTEWRFDEGEFVEEGEILLEVVCEQETVEVPAPCSGTLLEQIVAEDDLVRVGEPIAVIESEGKEEESDDEEDDEEDEDEEEEEDYDEEEDEDDDEDDEEE